jgi:hypothetical protein
MPGSRLQPGQSVYGFVYQRSLPGGETSLELTLTTRDKRRWKLASEFLVNSKQQRGQKSKWKFKDHTIQVDPPYDSVIGKQQPTLSATEMLRSRVHNRPKHWESVRITAVMSFDDNTVLAKHYAALFPASLMYSGIHLIVWNNIPMPTITGIWLWRVSAIMVAIFLPLDLLCFVSGGVGTFLALLVGYVVAVLVLTILNPPEGFREIKNRFRHFNVKDAPWMMVFPGLTFAFYSGMKVILVFLYVASRFILIIESLISLPYSPDTVFQQPSWLRYVPHIG